MNHCDREPNQLGYVDVTVVEFAAHIAYLDPRTGTGYLVTPQPETDLAAREDAPVEAVWSASLHDDDRSSGLSLHAADRRCALDYLAEEGWALLLHEDGEIETAGWTSDGRMALCLYGLPTAGEPCLGALSRALMALDIAADLGDRSSHRAPGERPSTD